MKSYIKTTQSFLYGYKEGGSESDPLFEDLSPTIIFNSPLGKDMGMQKFKIILHAWHESFPDLEMTSLGVEQHENTVFLPYHTTGTHLASFQGIAPTKRKIDLFSQAVFFFEREKVVRYTSQMDMVNLYKQLGLCLSQSSLNYKATAHKNKALLLQKIQEHFPTLLTNREIEIFSLYMIEIPLELISKLYSISRKDVEMHLSTIFEKCGRINKKQLLDIIKTHRMMSLVQDLGDLLLKA